jgi:magnesium transporter
LTSEKARRYCHDHDVLDVAEEEATEDIQRSAAQALEEPTWKYRCSDVKKRPAGTVLLFLGEMLTATAMGYFRREIERAVVLALFIPLIISSGGTQDRKHPHS